MDFAREVIIKRARSSGCSMTMYNMLRYAMYQEILRDMKFNMLSRSEFKRLCLME